MRPEAQLVATIRWGSLGPLLLISLAIMGSPGPATISLVATGSAYGLDRSLRYLAGIILGTTAVLVAVATGITAVLLAVPGLGWLLTAISVAYILWLAYHVATAPPLSQHDPSADAPSLAGGVLLGVANPKAWVAIAAVFASVQLAHPATTDAVAKTVALTAMIMVITTTWLMAGTSLTPILRDPRRARLVNTALALALVTATAIAVFH